MSKYPQIIKGRVDLTLKVYKHGWKTNVEALEGEYMDDDKNLYHIFRTVLVLFLYNFNSFISQIMENI
jgi:hypothetical protein